MARLRRADHAGTCPFIGVKRSRRLRARNDAIDPTADMRASFDHLVGLLLEVQRYVEAERLRGLEIDEQLERSRLLDRQFARLCALQDFIDENRSPLEISSVVCRVGDQPPSLCCVTIARHDREVVLGRELHDYARLRTKQRLKHYCLRARGAHCRKRAVEFTRTIYPNRLQLQLRALRRDLDVLNKRSREWVRFGTKNRDPRQAGDHLSKKVDAFTAKFRLHR